MICELCNFSSYAIWWWQTNYCFALIGVFPIMLVFSLMFYWSFVALNKLHPKLVSCLKLHWWAAKTNVKPSLYILENWLLSYDSLYIHMWLHKVSMCICFVCSWKWVYLLPICSSTLFSILSISIHFLRNVLVMLWVVTWAISYATPSGVGELNSFALVGFFPIMLVLKFECSIGVLLH